MAPGITAAIESASRVRVDVDEQTDHKRRRRRPPLIETADPDAIAQLAAALGCDGRHEGANLMMWPTLVITFQGSAPEMVTRIGYLHPGWLRQESWAQDRRLTAPEALPNWLIRFGWAPT